MGAPIVVNTVKTIERGATIGHGSVSLGTAAGTVLAASSTRRTILLTNLGTDYVWIGASTAITVNQGARVAPGQTFVIDRSPTAQVCGVATSGSQVLSYFTESD